MLRRDIIAAAGSMQSILFPIFTNATFMDDRCMDLLDRSRNLIPVISIEGDRETTDARRGEGIYSGSDEKKGMQGCVLYRIRACN